MRVCDLGKCCDCTRHPSKPTKDELGFFLEGVGIWHLSPIRQMSPYGGPVDDISQTQKASDCIWALEEELSVPTAVLAVFTKCSAWKDKGRFKMMQKRVSHLPTWIRQYFNTKGYICEENDKPGKAQLYRKDIPIRLGVNGNDYVTDAKSRALQYNMHR